MHRHLVGLHMLFRTSDGSYFNSMVWVHIFIICRNKTFKVLTSIILLGKYLSLFCLHPYAQASSLETTKICKVDNSHE